MLIIPNILRPQFEFSLRRVALKTLFLIGIGNFILYNKKYFASLSSPNYIQRNHIKNLINPPHIIPHRCNQPELYEKYLEHMKKIENIIIWSRYQYKIIEGTHPKLENADVIRDAFWLQENERLMEEAKNEFQQIIKQKNLKRPENLGHYIYTKQILNRLDSKIKIEFN